jgi:ACS family D-galactonate transporter-like MFS transporter
MGGHHAAHPAPTWGLIVMIGLMIALNYIDRGALSVAAPLMQGELGLSATGYGFVVSAFFWTYVPSQILAGWLADRVSVHRLMAAGVAIWGLATVLTGFVGGLVSLVLLRLLMGLGEGTAFPCASKLIARVPEESRGTANVALSSGLSMGPLIGTLAGGALLAAFGWREMFIVFGVATLAWLIPWAFMGRQIGPAPARGAPLAAAPYPELLRSPRLWAMCALHFAATYPFYFILAWMPLYLVKVRGYDIGQMALLTALLFLVQALSGAVMAVACDRLIARGAAASVVRRRLLFACLGLAALGIALIPLTQGLGTLIAALVITATGFGPVTVVLFTAGQTLAGPASAGRWVGIQSSVGNLAGIIGPVITGVIVDAVGYEPAFVLTAIVPLVGGLVFALGVPRIAPVAWRAAGA